MLFRTDRTEGATGHDFALLAQAPHLLYAPVDLDQRPQSVVAVGPAEPGAGDDPGVLVEPVVDPGPGAAGVLLDPGRELLRPVAEEDLVERLRRRAGNREGGLASADGSFRLRFRRPWLGRGARGRRRCGGRLDARRLRPGRC